MKGAKVSGQKRPDSSCPGLSRASTPRRVCELASLAPTFSARTQNTLKLDGVDGRDKPGQDNTGLQSRWYVSPRRGYDALIDYQPPRLTAGRE